MLYDEDFKKILEEEKKVYIWSKESLFRRFINRNYRRVKTLEFLTAFRKKQYWCAVKQSKDISLFRRIVSKILYNYYTAKVNSLGLLVNMEFNDNIHLGKNCNIWHSGIFINANVGDNCMFHGNNFLGNKGAGRLDETPTIGNNVDIGAGAMIIGKITIADGCSIGANSVVTSSFTEPNTTIIGIPGRAVETKKQ